MNKTEFKGQGVDEMRSALLELFEDPDGSIAEANKKALITFVDENWEYINSVINKEELDAKEAQDEEGSEAEEGEEAVQEVLTTVNLSTDLYTGHPPT